MGCYKLLVICIVCIGAATTQEQIPKPVIKSLHINSDIKYSYAKTYVVSTILNPAPVSQDVDFRVYVPERAFITGLSTTTDGKKYNSVLIDKEEANKKYGSPAFRGKLSGNDDFQDNSTDVRFRFFNFFSVAVNVESLKSITFNLTYEELIARNLNLFSHEIYVTPRQIVDDLSVVVNIEDGLDITHVQVSTYSPKVELNELEYKIKPNRTRISGNKYTIEWRGSTEDQRDLDSSGLNGRIVTLYDLDVAKKPQQILVDAEDGGYFAHFSRYGNNSTVIRKHVTFVLDASRAMNGSKMDQLRDAMTNILPTLPPNDYFSIVVYSTGSVAWSPAVVTRIENLRVESGYHMEIRDDYIVPAVEDNINAAKEFMKSLKAIGGSANDMDALIYGLRVTGRGRELLDTSTEPLEHMVIFLSAGGADYQSGKNETYVHQIYHHNNGVPIFCLGFGSDADMNFLRKLAHLNGGIARKIYPADDAAIQIQLFYNQLASPVPRREHFNTNVEQIESATPEFFITPFKGSQSLVLGRLRKQGGNGRFPFPSDATTAVPKDGEFGYVEKMWAYVTLEQYLSEMSLFKKETIKNKIKEIALKYSFLTPLTSLVVDYTDKYLIVNF